MSLQIDTAFRGLAAPGAIVTVAPKSISIEGKVLTFAIMFRASIAHEPYHWENYNTLYDMSGPNAFEQAYELLKWLPEFSGCIDC